MTALPSLKVCVCSNRHMPPQFVASFVLFMLHVAQDKETFSKVSLSLQPFCSCLPIGRQTAVAQALDENVSHMLFVDDDTAFPVDAAQRLLAHRKRVVGANFVLKMFPPAFQAKDLNEKELSSAGKSGLQEVSRIGFGLLLIETDVFRNIPMPHFLVDWKPGGGYLGEDVYCVQKLRAHGEKVFVDHDLSNACGHVGDFIYTQPRSNQAMETL